MTIEQFPSSSETEVRALVAELAAERGHEPAPLSTDQPLADVGFDSLLTIELVARLEDDLGVTVPDELLTPASFATLGSVVRLVDDLR